MDFKLHLYLALVAALALSLFTVSEAKLPAADKVKIEKGIKAGKDFANVLETTKDFAKVLKSLGETISPWVDAIGIFSDFIGLFLPEENEMLEEMKKGFEEVNKRLDAIRDGIKEVKEAIDWAVVKVNFQEIESNIRTMDGKLQDAMRAPNPDHGKAEYVRVYEDEYDEAGFKLYDSIVYDDQVFSQNILTAGMKYTEYTRSVHQKFMKGLLALIMKSSNIEISYESFKDHDRGMGEIWKNRLEQCSDAMQKADYTLQNAWQNLFREEVNKLAAQCQGCHHIQFTDLVFAHVTTKYFWRYWFVVSYDAVGGWDNHAVTHRGFNTHVVFRFHGRNFIIGTSDSSDHFDVNLAKSYLVDRHCNGGMTDCRRNAARKLIEATPGHGVLRLAISTRAGWAVKAHTTRSTWGAVHLRKDRAMFPFHLFYFG